VTDTGTGIASDQLEEICRSRFSHKEVGKGNRVSDYKTGIGFAKQSGGDIVVRKGPPGQGAIFTYTRR